MNETSDLSRVRPSWRDIVEFFGLKRTPVGVCLQLKKAMISLRSVLGRLAAHECGVWLVSEAESRQCS